MKKEKELQKLNKKIKNCKKCSLWRMRKNAVPGEGPANAKIMLVGQAPGAMENLKGVPFCGRAGKFLGHLLKIAGIDRKKIFITSPIKCFPPKNRKPKKKEIEACLPWLKKQIEIIKPKKFILLGEIAFSVFFPKDAKRPKQKLSNFRGKWIEKNGKFYFPTYHPAAGLRFPKIKKILKKDLKKLKNIL